MGKFIVKQTNTGIKFDLKAGNGEVIATSEVYASKASCLNGIESVKTCCAGAQKRRSDCHQRRLQSQGLLPERDRIR